MPNTEASKMIATIAGEQIARGNKVPAPEMLPNIELREYVSGRCGATGLSTGTATFAAGAVLPYHIHRFSEAVTILAGVADFKLGRCRAHAPDLFCSMPIRPPRRCAGCRDLW